MLQVLENSILQTLYTMRETWSFQDVLEAHAPLPGESLADHCAALREMLPKAIERYDELSDFARLRLEFWKLFSPQRIEKQQFAYAVDGHAWHLVLDVDGLFFTDQEGQFGAGAGTVYEQLHADFWFFGPIMPLPELETRKRVLAAIRNAFLQQGSPMSSAHFELFEYPPLTEGQRWQTGDFYRQDYVALRQYGMEHSATTWRDGLLYVSFLPFERFLARPSSLDYLLSDEMKAGLRRHLDRRPTTSQPKPDTLAPEPNATSKRLFMEALGNVHSIHRDGHDYHADANEEAAWRTELVEHLIKRLGQEDNETVLGQLAESLRENGAPVADLLYEAATTAAPKAKMALANMLMQRFDPERGVEVHLTLLELEAQDSYWRDYVFGRFIDMRENPAVHRWLLQCLHGDNELHFRKAVDTLTGWGFLRGHAEFADRELIRALNWQDACAADPDFTKALEKTTRLLSQAG